jgi:hypothetical protein
MQKYTWKTAANNTIFQDLRLTIKYLKYVSDKDDSIYSFWFGQGLSQFALYIKQYTVKPWFTLPWFTVSLDLPSLQYVVE